MLTHIKCVGGTDDILCSFCTCS